MTHTAGNHLDVMVVGAGQAGLVTGFFLKDTGLSYALYESLPHIGDSWRYRYDSLRLFSPRAYSALPGLPLPGDPEGYPTKDELADSLERYAQTFHLPVHTAEGIARLEWSERRFMATTTRGQSVEAAAVIVATGAFQQPVVPAFARKLASDVAQLTASTYRRPAQLPPGRVLVVGDGATGRQVASDWWRRMMSRSPRANRGRWCRNASWGTTVCGGLTGSAPCGPTKRLAWGAGCGHTTRFRAGTCVMPPYGVRACGSPPGL